MRGACVLAICFASVSCYFGDQMNACEVVAIRNIQRLAALEIAFPAEHGRFGSTEELGLPHPRTWCESGYALSLRLRENGYLIEARPRNYPTAGPAGRRSFYSDQTRVIHQAWRNGPAAASDPPIEAPKTTH
jgi:hypothetical protein